MDLEALMLALLSRDDRGIADQGVVNAGVRHQISLELVKINIEGAVKSQGRGDGANDLSDEAVQVFIAGAGNVEIAAADIVDSFVIHQEGTIRVLNGAVSGENGVVRLDDSSGDTGSGVHGELELRLFAILGRQTLEEQGAKARAGTTAK